ncbi:MAG TPA: DUF2059 domain-containing protein [Candidatus Angelobacter sp.]|nr:DUF2059 domain-containing protein [Candidatus Angelobacter sp.]
MKHFLMCAMVCFVLGATGQAMQNPADPPATREDVVKYLDAIHSHEMMQQMVAAMAGPMHKMVHDEYLKNQDRLPADFETRMNKMMDDMLQGMPWDEILQATVPAYQKHFTKGDLEALTTFYSSPTGQKILRELPAVTAESMETMMPIVRKHIEGVTQRMQEEMAEMEKKSTPPAKTPSTVRN